MFAEHFRAERAAPSLSSPSPSSGRSWGPFILSFVKWLCSTCRLLSTRYQVPAGTRLLTRVLALTSDLWMLLSSKTAVHA